MILTRPRGKQAASIVGATARINVWDGSVSSGKTIASLIKWLHVVATGPPGELLMMGKTERTLKRNVLDLVADMVGPAWHSSLGSGEAKLFGRRIYLAGANDERSEAKIRGLTLVGAYADEATTHQEAIWRMLTTRLRAPGAQLFATTNPDSPNHWLKKDWLDRAEELGIKRFQLQLDDNPNLEPEYVAAVKREHRGLWYRRFILGEWCIAEGAIYDMWDPATHVVKGKLPEMLAEWMGIDYGTSNAFVALHFGLGVDGHIYVTDEWSYDARKEQRQKTDSEYSEELQAWMVERHLAPARIWVDPSAASFRTQLKRDGVKGARAADNTVDDGLRVVARSLSELGPRGRPRLQVHERCRGLIDELPGYVWDPKAQLMGLDQPLKQNDHHCDALRYGVKSHEFIWRRAELDRQAA